MNISIDKAPRFPMKYKDLRDFLQQLDHKGELKRISARVSPDLEMTEIADRVLKSAGPALLFENPGDSQRSWSIPVLANLFGTPERVARASSLLSTRVDIARERQNQALLSSMNRRAKLQLRLQQTVEGLSVAAIVYYLAGLVGYVTKSLKAGGLKLEPDLMVGIAVPVLAALAILAVRRARRHAAEEPTP